MCISGYGLSMIILGYGLSMFISGYGLMDYARKKGVVPNRESCMALCKSERAFPCR